MAAQQPVRADPGPSLPAFERLAPPAAADEFAAVIEALTRPGDTVVDLHGRGGWVARAAIAALRRSATFESQPLTRLLAEVVLRPPDVRHLDAAFQAIAGAPLGETTVRGAIAETYTSVCPNCGRNVVLDEVIWDADGPAKRVYRCASCRDQASRGEQRHAAVLDADRAAAVAEDAFRAAREAIADRFPISAGVALEPPSDASGSPFHPLVQQLLDLHTPRQLGGLALILRRIEDELRAAPVTAALRLAFLQGLLPASRLNAYPGRMGTLRIAGGRLRQPSGSQWRERNPWLAFEDGYRIVRGFVQRLEGTQGHAAPVGRLGTDLRSLGDGMANTLAALATPSGLAALAAEAEVLRSTGTGPRVRLVLGQAPLAWTQDRLGAAYHATAWVLGREAASLLPLDQVFGAPPPSRWDWQAATIRSALAAVGPAIAPDGRVVLLLGAAPPEAMVAAAVGGVAAGFGLVEARSGSDADGDEGLVSFVPPGTGRSKGPRTRANRPLPPLGEPQDADWTEGPAGRGETAAHADRERSARMSARIAGEIVTQTAVEVLQARGEPAPFERLLGEILVGLDATGQLNRLAARGAEPLTQAERSTAPLSQVESLLAMIREELTRPDNRRLQEVEPGQWWLARADDRAEAAVPLADRVEWAVFGLLSTAGRLSENAFFDRVGRMFRGHDKPEEELVEASLASYRDPTTGSELLVARDTLQQRSEEHDRLLATLADMGHGLGMDVWIGRRAQGRRVGGRLLGDWLDQHERTAYLPLAAKSAADALEEVDCIWYVRGRVTILFEVEWTAMLGDPVLRRHARIATDDDVVRFLVILPERVELVRHKLARSPLLRRALEEGNWHILKANHLRTLAQRERVSLADFEPFLGLDPEADRAAEQLGLFG